MALALSGQHLKGKYNNQPSVGISGGRESGEVAHGGGGAYGETLTHRLRRQIEQPKNNENKIHGGVNWPPIGKPKHNNQRKTGGRDGGQHGGDMRRAGRVGEG